jgi:hypothetical protein
MSKREIPTLALMLAVVVGGFCLITGAWNALVQHGASEAGLESTRGDTWAYLPVGIAAGVLGLAVFLLVRRMRRRAK